ncbi:DUF3043 domain-containing protein [Nesterenkonia sp. HG001]|uniref:DUF3043 domain-containing protein n=1 Tax=Nesterenkonia sp. HG001 TaxID=2983207 RepID=UPI002AC6AA15|nr:DUF3043 domain-containing protein [Nesterenkonia sp. HG001]MDZ5077949.1 DUF3043 domain-containing protein [Nesterenkonia sp. HG001]
MLGRKKKQEEAEVARRDAERAEQEAREAEERRPPQPKGQPTPRRKDQVAARRRPLVPNDRKVARQTQRERTRQLREKQRIAMETGDERYLPVRDRGPQRRFVRDWIDARTGVGEWMLIVVLLFLFVSLAVPEQLRIVMSQFLWLLVLVVLVECWWVARSVRRKIEERFGEKEKGIRFYAIMRALQIRRLRLPKPLVGRGEFPS